MLRRRGPDSCQEQHFTTEHVALDLFGTVLSMRGALTAQPITDQHGNCLIWNGELFGLRDATTDVSDPAVHDTQLVLDWLAVTCDADHVMRVLARIEGPYALIYYQRATQRIYFARDPLGRRSLLLSAGTSHQGTDHVPDASEEGEGDIPPPLIDRLATSELSTVMLSSVKFGDR